MEEVKAIMGGVVEKFQPVLEERFPATRSRSASPTASCPPWAGAPVCLLVFMLKPDYPDRDGAMQSVSAAIENVLLAAWAKGHRLLLAVRAPAYGLRPCVPAPLRPRQGEFVAAVTLGYPDQQPKMPPRRDGRYLIV